MLLTSVFSDVRDQYVWAAGPLTRLLESASADRFKIHTLTDDPEKADLILFAEMADLGHYMMTDVLSHPLYKQYSNKVFLYWPADKIIPRVPGIYASIEKQWYRADRTRGGCYLDSYSNPYVKHRKLEPDAQYLASFVGSVSTHPVRQQILKLNSDRFLLEDVSKNSLKHKMADLDDKDKHHFWENFANTLADTKFPLCPRGEGCSSIRLFESMEMGRAPVIISDDWVPVEGPKWEEFSLRVAESDVANIPSLLQSNEHRAVEMGEIARGEWENWFSEKVIFHRMVEACLDIMQIRQRPESIERRIAEIQYLRPYHAKAFLRPYIKRLLRRD
ncbi:MAG: exostosin family protein [Armatimonadota bacterium]